MSIRILLGVAVLLSGGIVAVNAQTNEAGSRDKEQDAPKASQSTTSRDTEATKENRRDEEDETDRSAGSADHQTPSTFAPSDHERSDARSDRDASDRDNDRQSYDRSRRERGDSRREYSERARRSDRDRSEDSDRADDRSRDRNEEADRSHDEDRRADERGSSDDRRSWSNRRDEQRSEGQLGISFGKSRDGLVIARINPRSLAADSDLREGDQILSIDGRRVTSPAQFRGFAIVRSGRVPIVIWRDGERRTVYWSGDERYGSRTKERERTYRDEGDQEDAFLGVVFDARYDDAAVIQQVYPNSPAQRAGVRPGDTILSINGNSVSSPDDVTDVVADMQPGDQVELQISHAPPRTLEVRLGTRQQRGYTAYRGESWETDNRQQYEEQTDRRPFDRDREGLFRRTTRD
jgi:C-terminal processing protease CtpA/Prc